MLDPGGQATAALFNALAAERLRQAAALLARQDDNPFSGRRLSARGRRSRRYQRRSLPWNASRMSWPPSFPRKSI